MTTTDLNPGDLVQHPEHGYGVVLKNFPGVPTIYFAGKHGYENTTRRFTGWERVEAFRPGHVQVRVDDLELGGWLNEPDDGNILGAPARLAIRAAKVVAAQRAESTPPADEKPASATVTLPCPDCGGATPVTVVMLGRQSNGERWFDLRDRYVHTCPPAQPDEPTEPGIRVSVCDMRLVSLVQSPTGKRLFADVKSGHVYDWDDLTERGTVTIGWDE